MSATVGADGRTHLAASVWRSTADCGDPRRVELPLTLPPGSYDFVDDTSGHDLGTVLLGTIGTPSGNCSAIPESSGCTDDCQCEASDPSLRCLGALGNHGLCARPCTSDRDCPESLRPRCTTETSVHFVCYSTADDCCTADSCGAGFTCSRCTCRPLGAGGGDCRCDADCASGICGDGTCVTPA